MKILLVDVDSKIPNLVLMKLSTHHKNLGNEVELIQLKLPGYPHTRKFKTIDAEGYDKVYVSSIFTVNQGRYEILNCDNVEYGGTGYDLTIKLPKEIDDLKEDYSIYPDNKISYGYITRGCIRKCEFCFVPKKEGKLHFYRDWKEILQDGHKQIKFMDNNFLAYPEHKQVLQELIDSKVRVEFNQGLDIKLIEEENSELLRKLKYGDKYTFAFDDIKDEKIIVEKLRKYLSWGKNWKLRLFIYCNAEMPLSEVIYRIMFCKKNKIMPYLMRDKNCWLDLNQKFYTDMADYANQPNILKKMDFTEYEVKRYTQDNKDMQQFYTDLNMFCNNHAYASSNLAFVDCLTHHFAINHQGHKFSDKEKQQFYSDLRLYCNYHPYFISQTFEEAIVSQHMVEPLKQKAKRDKETEQFYGDINRYCNWHSNITSITFEEWLKYHYEKHHLTKNSYNRILTSKKLWDDNYAEPNYLVWEE